MVTTLDDGYPVLRSRLLTGLHVNGGPDHRGQGAYMEEFQRPTTRMDVDARLIINLVTTKEMFEMRKVKKIPVLAFMFFATQSASAQLSLGVVGGVNFFELKVGGDQPIAVPLPTGGNVQGSFNSRTAFAIGGVAEYYFSPMVGLSVQPMYSQQGSEFVFEGPVVAPLNAESTTKLSYVDIPVMLKVQFGRSNVKPYVTSGFTLGFLTSAKSVGGGEETNIKDSVKSTNSSWSIGGGFNLLAPGSTVFIEGRYTLGLSTIDEELQVQPLSATTELKTKGFQLLVGVTFPLGVQ